MLPSTVRLDAVGEAFLSSRDSIFSSIDMSDDVFDDQSEETSAFIPSPPDSAHSPTRMARRSANAALSNSTRKESIGFNKPNGRSVKSKVLRLFSVSP